jgi:hypothetical protein
VTKDDDVMFGIGGRVWGWDEMRSIDRSDRDYRGILNTLSNTLPSTAYSSFRTTSILCNYGGDLTPALAPQSRSPPLSSNGKRDSPLSPLTRTRLICLHHQKLKIKFSFLGL